MSMDEAKYPMIEEFGRNGATLAHESILEGYLGLHSYTSMALCKTAIAPFDRVKLLLQNQRGMMLDGRLSEPYKDFGNCFQKTITAEGFASLWRGNTVNLIRYLPSQGITFRFWDLYKRRRSEVARRYEIGHIYWFVWDFGAGSVGGMTSAIVSHPIEYAYTRLAIDAKKGGAERQFKGLADLCRKTFATDGILGFYRGFPASVLGEGFYRGFYFATYEALKAAVLSGKKQDSFFDCFALAWASATIAGSIVYPMDVIRRRAMAVRPSGGWDSTALAMFQLEKKCGRRALYAGVGANIPRAIVGAAVLAAYDTKLNLLFP